MRRQCDSITISAELLGTGGSASFHSRYTERDGTCTFTYADSGQRAVRCGFDHLGWRYVRRRGIDLQQQDDLHQPMPMTASG